MRNKTIKSMTISAIIIAIIALMTFVPFVGYIAVGPVSICIIHLVVLLAAMLFDWKQGLVAGLAFGLLCLLKAATMPTSPTDYMFLNPIVSVLPRAIFGLVSGLIFSALKKIKSIGVRTALYVVCCVLLTLTHTVLVLVPLWAFNQDVFGTNIMVVLTSIIGINCIIEMSSAAILVPGIARIVGKAKPAYDAYAKVEKEKKMSKNSKFSELSKIYENELVANLYDFVAINSVYDETTANEENQFGIGVSKALQFITDLAIKDGFKATNYKNKVVEILCGEGDKNITIMAHADVVPAGATGWKQDPFEVTEENGVFCGRGVADDKGPLLSAYYAMKLLRDNGMLGDYQIRFLVGGNEESGSLGIEYYFKDLKKSQPTYGFSPDAEYPLIFAEKAITNFVVSGAFKVNEVISIEGGVASNSVIEKCVVKLEKTSKIADYIKENNINAEIKENANDVEVTFIGKAAHGATPEEGVNAGMIAIDTLGKFYGSDDLNKIVELYSDLYGAGINAYTESPDMGKNSLNVGLLSYKDGKFSMTVNFRFVDTVNGDELIANIKEASKPYSIEVISEAPLLFYPKDSVLVSTLLEAYQTESGDYESKPKAIGGGTYAKEADNVVAFGMEFPGWNSQMHSPGESCRREDLIKSISIYARAIYELGKKL